MTNCLLLPISGSGIKLVLDRELPIFQIRTMKGYPLLIFLIISLHTGAQNKRDSLMGIFEEMVGKVSTYDEVRVKEIESLKSRLWIVQKNEGRKKFDICDSLFDQYRMYNYDSAFFYTVKLNQLAVEMKSDSLVARANLDLGFILLSSGMFKEAIEVLNKIQVQKLPNNLKAGYYSLTGRYYYDLTDYNDNSNYSKEYKAKAAKYIDSALVLYPVKSFEYNYFKGLKNLKSGNPDSSVVTFSNILQNRKDLSLHNFALTTSTLSGFYIQQHNDSRAIELLMEAAIADIQSSTKETTATLNLSVLLFRDGDIQNALLCIRKANDDAQFYGSRQRKIQIGNILPVIEGQVIHTIEAQKMRLWIYSISVSILFLIVIGLIIIINKQLSKLRKAKDTISKAHEKEKEINQLLKEANLIKDNFNQQLTLVNNQLNESNKIKEEYIGYFFHIDYQVLDKFEKFKTAVEKKLQEKKLDEIRFLIQHTNIVQEKEQLLDSFDQVFIRLFPDFVDEFNKLFLKEDQVLLKEKTRLNTELRIFALMRIGITDNEKIAGILNYSVNTIYTYKTKIRNRSLIPNETFDQVLFKATNMALH